MAWRCNPEEHPICAETRNAALRCQKPARLPRLCTRSTGGRAGAGAPEPGMGTRGGREGKVQEQVRHERCVCHGHEQDRTAERSARQHSLRVSSLLYLFITKKCSKVKTGSLRPKSKLKEWDTLPQALIEHDLFFLYFYLSCRSVRLPTEVSHCCSCCALLQFHLFPPASSSARITPSTTLLSFRSTQKAN